MRRRWLLLLLHLLAPLLLVLLLWLLLRVYSLAPANDAVLPHLPWQQDQEGGVLNNHLAGKLLLQRLLGVNQVVLYSIGLHTWGKSTQWSEGV